MVSHCLCVRCISQTWRRLRLRLRLRPSAGGSRWANAPFLSPDAPAPAHDAPPCVRSLLHPRRLQHLRGGLPDAGAAALPLADPVVTLLPRTLRLTGKQQQQQHPLLAIGILHVVCYDSNWQQ